ncbi:1466_t:CDS:2, partial [Cetraspora pellucida]
MNREFAKNQQSYAHIFYILAFFFLQLVVDDVNAIDDVTLDSSLLEKE